jgi:hypothetical protein
MGTNVSEEPAASIFGVFMPFRVIRQYLSSGMKQYTQYIVAAISVELAGTIFKVVQEGQTELKKIGIV